MREKRSIITGFTLLELVLVLAILATALAAVAPSLTGFTRGRKPEDAARQFVALAHWARSQAVSDGETYRLVIDPQGRNWHMSRDDGDQFVHVEGPFGRTYTLPEGVELETDVSLVDGQQAITFDASGRSDVAKVKFIGEGSVVEVACEAPVDDLHIVVNQGGR